MATLDQRLPYVYVSVEDQSYQSETIEGGRSVYVVLLSDRGRHNQIIELNPSSGVVPKNQLHDEFGKPNFIKYGQAHYLADIALRKGAKVYAVRPVLINEEDSQDRSHLMSIANVVVKYNNPNGSFQLVRGSTSTSFVFTSESNEVSTDIAGIDGFSVGDYITHEMDAAKAKKITAIDEDTMTITLDDEYTITSSGMYCYKYYPGSELVTGNFTFTNGSNIVTVSDNLLLDKVSISSWIYSEADKPTVGESGVYARQVISKNTTTGEIILDKDYEGTSGADNLYKYVPFVTTSYKNVRNKNRFDTTDNDNLWYFYVKGAGSYYNNMFIKGTRNTSLEKMYIDNDGNPLYPYNFMDLSVYKNNGDGTISKIEGPFTVSLMPQDANGIRIKDINTDRDLYITTVINENSNFIKCEEGYGTLGLLTLNKTYPYEPDNLKRLQLQTLFTEGNILNELTVGGNGVIFDNGGDGNLFNENGTLNLTDEYKAIISRSFNGTLKSVDGSVESIRNEVYPKYIIDYIASGGYPATIQNYARELAQSRGTILVLGDTGQNYTTADDDIVARQTAVPWNTWCAALYTQYRRISCPYTGRKFYVTPVYHALERHLHVDANYWISEPVANIEKGAISEQIELAYETTDYTKLMDMIDKELNPVMVEPDGTYLISELTTWKKYSKMKKQSSAKFIQYVQKTLPRLLKDILQRKSTSNWLSQIDERISKFMNQFKSGSGSEKYESMNSFSYSKVYNEDASEVNVMLSINLLGTIERIKIGITVV
jgi:hypothetical protein